VGAVQFPASAGKLSLLHRVQTVIGANPPMGTRGSSSGSNANHSPPSSAEVKNTWRCISIRQYVFMAWYLVKEKENLFCRCCYYYYYYILSSCCSPTVTHACRKKRLKWIATLPLGVINTEAWSFGMGVGRGANNLTVEAKA
jgi:hypothetical protein